MWCELATTRRETRCTQDLVGLAARGESPPTFDKRGILAVCVTSPSSTGGIFSRRALSARRLARLDATPDFRHGLLVADMEEDGLAMLNTCGVDQ